MKHWILWIVGMVFIIAAGVMFFLYDAPKVSFWGALLLGQTFFIRGEIQEIADKINHE